MPLVFIVLYLLSLGLLVIITSMRFQAGELSTFELKRRANAGDRSARESMNRERHKSDVFSLQQVAIGLLYVAATLFGIAAFHWIVGVILSIIVAVLLGVTTRLTAAKRYSKVAYKKTESMAQWLEERYPRLLRLIRHAMPSDKDMVLGSREELEHLITHASGALSPDEKHGLTAMLAFQDKTVRELMVPRAEVDTISSTELLGPLVLDDLHKTGHSLIPVTAGEDNHIVGILHLKDVTTLDKKRSLTAGKAMATHLFYVREDHSLEAALAILLQEQQQLLVVVNESVEAVGIISLKDVIAALRGRTSDTSESYDDPRRVALAEHSRSRKL